jgi:hypothetical protein
MVVRTLNKQRKLIRNEIFVIVFNPIFSHNANIPSTKLFEHLRLLSDTTYHRDVLTSISLPRNFYSLIQEVKIAAVALNIFVLTTVLENIPSSLQIRLVFLFKALGF